MSQNQSNANKTLLAARLINYLPFASSVRGYYPSMREFYQNTKISNSILEAGLNYAEGTVASASAPLLSRYEKIDSFASTQLEKLGDVYEKEGLPSLARKGALTGVRVAAYPVGFTVEMAHHARELAAELATPALSKAYDMIDDVIDNLLPADADEEEYDDVSGLTVLQRKSPARRLRKRLNYTNVINLPSTSFNMSKDIALDLSYRGVIVGKVFRDQFIFSLDRSLQALSHLEALVVARPIGFAVETFDQARRTASENGEALAQAVLVNALHRADSLKQKLDEAKLPKSSYLVDRISNDLQNLASFFGIRVTEENEGEAHSSNSSRTHPHRLFPNRHPKLHDFSTAPSHVNHYLGDQRMPTFYSGEDQLARESQREEERMPTMLLGQGERATVQRTLEEERTPSIVTFAAEPVEVSAPAPVEEEEEVEVEEEEEDQEEAPSTSEEPHTSEPKEPTPTPNMPMVIVADEPHSSKSTKHMPRTKIVRKAKKPVSASNPYDLLDDADSGDMPLDTPAHHEVTDAEVEHQREARREYNHNHNHHHGHHNNNHSHNKHHHGAGEASV